MKSIQPSIKDVAREAACSIATVSFVINDRGRISTATKARVRRACKKLGYYPSAAGRNLRNRRSETIGALFYPSCSHIFGNVFYSRIMEGLEEEFTKAGQNLLLAGYDLSSRHEDLPKFIRDGSVDGVILLGGCPDDFQRRLSEIELPVLLLDTEVARTSFDSVTSDGHRAMIDMVSCLHQKGHREMLMFRHTYDNFNEDIRCMGFENETRRLELADHARVIKIETNDEAAGHIISRLRGPAPVTAVCTVNDDMAADIMIKLRAAGIRIPEQVSITGYDDTEFARSTDPPLTTIRIDRKQMGSEGARTILQRIANPEAPPRKLVIPHQLIERESVRTLN